MNQQEQALFLTLYYLDDTSLAKACQVNKKFYQRICNNIWLHRLKTNFPNIIQNFPQQIQNKPIKDQYWLLVGLDKLRVLEPIKNLSLLEIYKLETLDLTDNRLTQLPAEIGNLVNLKALYLYENRLTQLPAEIGQLVNLKVLNLSNNRLTHLPVEIWGLVGLLNLYLYSNPLTEIPVEIKKLVNLILLSVSPHVKLPAEITDFPDLAILGISRVA